MEPVGVLILAGGRSSRMGRDKVWLDWNGLPLVEHVARRLQPFASEILFSTNSPARYEGLAASLSVPVQLVPDVYPGAGPLAGLHAGLTAARSSLVFAVAADMPFVEPRLVEEMVAACGDSDALIPLLQPAGFDNAQPEPLHALYRKTCLPAIESALAAGRRRVVAFLDDVRVRYIPEEALRRIDPELRSFRNVNTPEEWDAARREMGY